MRKLFEIDNIRCSYDKNYQEGVSKIVLDIKHLILPKGKKVFIVGESGIGKSTILEVLGLMNNTIVPKDDSKFIFFEDERQIDLLKLWAEGRDGQLSAFRLKHFNFIFQSTNLMRNFSAYENVALTRMLQGYTREEAFRRASEVLADLGLEHIDEVRMTQELSGGQQQRLAFARAILPDFTVLFGDEPTGNLDSDNAVKAMELLSAKLNELQSSSAVIVTHDMPLAMSFADMIIKIRKEKSPVEYVKDEVSYMGVIDENCVFVPDENRDNWSNGILTFGKEEFKLFLKKI